MNGLKHQTVDSAFGIVVDLFGPMSLRRNDMVLLGESRVSPRFEELQTARDATRGRLKIRGDSAYINFGAICTYNKNANLTEREHAENIAYKSVRESIEWGYGTTAALFRYLQNLGKLQVMKAEKTYQVYTVATILRNCHVIFYGCQKSCFFNVAPGRSDAMPTLTQYLHQL
jgi:hypothetical protein